VFDRITFECNTMGGRACIRGMRIPVSVIVGQFAHGASEEEILADYPELETEDIRQAWEYAAWLAQEEVHTLNDPRLEVSYRAQRNRTLIYADTRRSESAKIRVYPRPNEVVALLP
jgi:uncharacterized protein (DUF433 family)